MIDSGHDGHGPGSPITALAGADLDALRSLVQWAESFLENAPAPVTIIRAAGYRLIYANAAFRRLYAMAASARELTISDLLDPYAAREVEALVARALASSALAHEGLVTPPGAPTLHCSAWPLFGKQGRAVGLVMVELRAAIDADVERALQVNVAQRLVLSALHDQAVAEAAGAAEKLAELANSAKARFLTTMSHELRTPLNAIGGYAELIDMGLRGPVTKAQREDLSRIQRAQEHLLGLINSVLNFSKLESGSVQFEMMTVPLEPMMASVEEMLMPHLERQGLAYENLIIRPPHCERLTVNADPEKLRQILINLLTNAIKFTSRGGTISTSCDVAAETILVHVADTGRGIPADKLASVFDPFVQVGRRLSSSDQGVGLGLSISRDLARHMGGDLTAASTLDVGSTFTLALRRSDGYAP
jgi:signal transduction histidine kinase